MMTPPARNDLDATRGAIATEELVGTASSYLTTEIAVHLPFESLGPYKTLLKLFFSDADWSTADADALSDIVVPAVGAGWWEHELSDDIRLAHGIKRGRYQLFVWGGTARVSVFDQAFSGSVVPEATPHPRKVKFSTGGDPSQGIWYRRSDPDIDRDPRVQQLMHDPDITDVMVAGDFVTVGLVASASWEDRLMDVLGSVTSLFGTSAAAIAAPERTREELLHEAVHLTVAHQPEELHLLDPDNPSDVATLESALSNDDPRVRRIAVAVLVESPDRELALDVATTAFRDPSRIVRRTAIDAAADTGDPGARGLFEAALTSDDAWIRWKAVRALGEIGLGESYPAVAALADDTDFQVRLEVASVTRS